VGNFSRALGIGFILNSCVAMANDKLIRWTGTEDQDATLKHVVEKLSQKLGRPISQQDFLLEDDRDLAFNHYQRWVQVLDHVPIHGKSIRIWKELNSEKAIQVEAALQSPSLLNRTLEPIESVRSTLSSEKTVALAREMILANSEDPHFMGLEWKDEWIHGELVRVVKIRGKRGYHFVFIDFRQGKVISHKYREFPQVDPPTDDEGLSIPVQVYPIYEEAEEREQTLPRISAELRHIKRQIPIVEGDFYAPLKTKQYFDFNFDPTLGDTEAGRAQGHWSMSYLKGQAAKIRSELPQTQNDWSKGVLLQGQFATINIHPDAIPKFNPGFQIRASTAFFPNWIETSHDGKPAQEMIPSHAFAGKPLQFPNEAWDRPAHRLPDHNPAQYLNDGFDEIQVYYAINTLFENLQARGFKDPELSTRPFNAFLFNPDIASRNNAFYTDDTINFTTYSPHEKNYARDNSTIWHELGHGVMDRLMGDSIELADTGGLSEGMADFVAALVIQSVTQGKPFPGSKKFRIINKTGFYLTNEVHDDGEAYGGAMKDFMDAVIGAHAENGLNQVADIVLETMRLTRDFPGLNASDWFDHLLFADSLGRPGLRQPGELKPFLLTALAERNFKLGEGSVAEFHLVNLATHQEIESESPGSRNAPILVRIPKDGKAHFDLSVQVKSSQHFSFHYPLQIRVEYKGGPLQGALHWTGKEKEAQTYLLNSEADQASIPLEVSGTCDEINRADGSCVDFAYIQVWNSGETERPAAKKRFYLQVKNP